MVGPALMASVVCSTELTAQAAWTDACALASNEEFQRAYGINPQIGIIPNTPEQTEMVWGPHCDYTAGSITLFTKKTPSSELDRVLGMANAGNQRVPVQGLGDRAFFTVIYPDDKYRRAGLLAVFVGSRIVSFTMDADEDKRAEETQPKLESLAKLALPRLE
jgi:hypothetical protein